LAPVFGGIIARVHEEYRLAIHDRPLKYIRFFHGNAVTKQGGDQVRCCTVRGYSTGQGLTSRPGRPANRGDDGMYETGQKPREVPAGLLPVLFTAVLFSSGVDRRPAMRTV
jgi:hypothetical protein